jgi:hypothetical protein
MIVASAAFSFGRGLGSRDMGIVAIVFELFLGF